MNNSRELWFKDGIKWKNDDNLIEYNQIKSFKFLPSESNGKLRDQVTVPNIPMIVSCTFLFFNSRTVSNSANAPAEFEIDTSRLIEICEKTKDWRDSYVFNKKSSLAS